MIDHQPRVGVSLRQLLGLVQTRRAREIDRQGVLRRQSQNPVDGRVGGSVETLSLKKTRIPTVPLVETQSAIVSATPGSVGSTGLTSLNRLGCALYTSRA